MHCLPDAFMEDAPTVRWNSEAWQYSTTCPRLLYKVHRYWWNYYSQNVGTKSFRAWLHRYHKVTTLDRLINLLILCHALQLAVLQHRWFETEDLQQDILVCCQFSVTWRNDWECVSSAHWTDGGSSSPLLRDLIWMEWLRGHRRARGTIRLAHELSARSIGRYYWGPKRERCSRTVLRWSSGINAWVKCSPPTWNIIWIRAHRSVLWNRLPFFSH